MGYDSILADTFDQAVEQLATEAKAIDRKLVRNTDDGIFAGGDTDRADPGFIAYHRLYLLLSGEATLEIAVLMLKEFRVDGDPANDKREVAYKWIAERCGPSVMDTCVIEWFDKAPTRDPDWRYEIRSIARRAELAARKRMQRAARKATGA